MSDSGYKRYELTKGWTFAQKEKHNKPSDWMPVATVTTNVHLDLMSNEKIPDPNIGFNELSCQWVAEKTWLYRTVLPPLQRTDVLGDVDEKVSKNVRICIVFEGLDTFATARLNGKTVLQSDNMFVPHRVDMTDIMYLNDHSGDNREERNELEIEFESATCRARGIRDAFPEHKWVCWNGDSSRLAARKAQYHWGWDWGPLLTTCGPWKSVYLEVHEARMDELRIDYMLSEQLDAASGNILASVEHYHEGLEVVFSVELDSKICMKEYVKVDANGKANCEFSIEKPLLWYPYQYGPQSMYLFTAKLRRKSGLMHKITRQIGFRRAELVQQYDQDGKSFYFRVNRIDIFAGGSNWIPADNFTTRISDKRYRNWLQSVRECNQSMIRVWGGGIYENDIFYDLCDELGILVWQDFMFACGNYPAFPNYLESVRKEFVANLRRLCDHPCIIMYAGNNEDYQVQESAGLKYDYSAKDPQSWLKTDFPARYIYEKLLPEIVTMEAPHIAYHPGSPWGDGLPTTDPGVGDLHQWNVWHGTQEKYQSYEKLGGRFVSEFGMEAFPYISTIKSFCTDPSQLYPQSRLLDFHNKAAGQERRIATYLFENVRLVASLEGFIHLTQILQSEALKYAYTSWRRQWDQPGNRKCGGALVWQLNDCWPCISWSVIDYFQVKKPAYYAIKRALASLSVCVRRFPRCNENERSLVNGNLYGDNNNTINDPSSSKARKTEYEIWIASSHTCPQTADVEIRFVGVNTGQDIFERIYKKDNTVRPNGTTNVHHGYISLHDRLKRQPDTTTPSVGKQNDKHSEIPEPYIITATLSHPSSSSLAGTIISCDTDWPQPLKYLDFADRNVEVKLLREEEGMIDGDCENAAKRPGRISIKAGKPTKGFVFEERPGLVFEDNGFDVIPDEIKMVEVWGLDGLRGKMKNEGGREASESESCAIDGGLLRWRYLGM